MIVRSPIDGTIVALAEVPDPVFSGAMVGPGLAIDPAGSGVVRVLAPIAGTVGALHPHAFAIEAGGKAVLVHLGLDTVTLKGAPFTVHCAAGEEVTAGQLIVEWHIEEIGALSPLTPVVALGAASVEVIAPAGTRVVAGSELFTVPDAS